MSSTGLEHPLVREYLRELDAALSTLPADRAAELREQITAHLDETLTSGADDGEVAATLSRLGSPADLAAEAGAAAAGASTPAQPPPVTVRSLARTRLARVRKRTWAMTAIAIVLIGAGLGYLTVYLSVGDLQQDFVSMWWYPQDSNHEVDTSADGAQQSTVPIRDGHRQGYAVDLYNPTDFTQTVLGPAVGPDLGANAPSDPNSQTLRLGVSVPNRTIENGGGTRDVRFVLPGSIPPHQIRLLRVLWVSNVCPMERGSALGIDQLNLRVRIGWFTRTETIPLDQGWYLSGPSHCS